MHSDSVLNVKAVVAAFNQKKALLGAFSVIVQLHRLIVYTALFVTLPLVSSRGICSRFLGGIISQCHHSLQLVTWSLGTAFYADTSFCGNYYGIFCVKNRLFLERAFHV